MSNDNPWKAIFDINGRFLRAACCAGIGWVFWQGFKAGVEVFGYIAAVFAAGTIFHGVIAVFQTAKAIGGQTRWKRFRKGHAKPKADPIGERDAMRARGMFK